MPFAKFIGENICFHCQELLSVHQLLLTRYQLHRTAYSHCAVSSIDTLETSALLYMQQPAPPQFQRRPHYAYTRNVDECKIESSMTPYALNAHPKGVRLGCDAASDIGSLAPNIPQFSEK